jgi:predicted flap endonuclease-1-like 5' DNA nuclease
VTNIAHIVETALLLLAAHLLGCVIGYAIRRILFAARGTRKVAPVLAPVPVPEPVPQPRRVPTPAARLAASVSDAPDPLPAAAIPKSSPAKALKRAPKPAPADPKPPALTAPRGGQADNLKQIKGIGPKIEASLNALGIYHFDQIAVWTKANTDWVDARLAFKGRIRRERWVEQAVDLTKVRA